MTASTISYISHWCRMVGIAAAVLGGLWFAAWCLL